MGKPAIGWSMRFSAALEQPKGGSENVGLVGEIVDIEDE